MKKLLLLFLLIGAGCATQKVYVPAEGSAERREIIDLFREGFGEGRDEITFEINHFLVHKNWACASVTPRKDNVEVTDPWWSLFNKVDGVWQTVDWSEGLAFEDDFELIDLPAQNSRVAKLIVEKYPTCPMDIFGQ
jgi:hypothetical protein